MTKSDRYDSLIVYYAEKHGLKFELIKAQIRAESNFDPYAVSRRKDGTPIAHGLCQFTKPTWGDWGSGNIYDVEEQIKAQCKYMKFLIKRFGDEERALASYNWGMGNLGRMLKRTGWDPKQLPKETQTYLVRVEKFKKSIVENFDHVFI